LVQLAEHWPMHVVLSALVLHWPLQDASQLVEQLPEQLKLPWFAMQVPMQSPEQLPVQLALMETLQLADTLAVQLTGVQSAVQPPDVSKVHDRLVAPAKSMLSHAAMGAAWAVLGASATRTSVMAAATADRQ
jgi:hypothetical protein